MILPVGEYRCTLCKFSITAKTKLCLTIGAKLQVKSRTPCILFRSSTILSWLQFYIFITGTFTYLEKSARGSQLPLESSDEEILDELASWSFCESRRNSAKNKTKKTNRHPIKNKQTKQNKTVLSVQLVTWSISVALSHLNGIKPTVLSGQFQQWDQCLQQEGGSACLQNETSLGDKHATLTVWGS